MSRANVAGPQQNRRDGIPWAERVLFIDGEALVIDKPAGLAVHPGARTPASLEDHLGALRFGFARPPAPVHRLDRDTSGCLLLARNPKAQRRFQRAFEAGEVAKTYIAIVEGVPQAEEGRIEMALGKVSSREAGWRIVPDAGGKAAATGWRLIAARAGRSAILFTPATGRTHQIRVHCASGLGLPIAGDPVYGDGRGPMLLHALSLGMAREGKNPVEASAPLPPSFAYAGFGDVLAEPYVLPEEALEEKFLAATGPGGQNVNKVATAVQLRCNVFALGLAPPVFARLRVLAGSRMTNEGEIVVTARGHRTQDANRQEARARLADLIARAHIAKPKRIRTSPSRAARARRVDTKKGRSTVKQGRARPAVD